MNDQEIIQCIQNGEVNKVFEFVYENIPENTDSLRKFHNLIKQNLIHESKRKTDGKKLMDVAVGRGGDIMKWSKANFRYVTAFDNDKKSIYEKNEFDGAIKRYQQVKCTPKCFFWNISATDQNVLEIVNSKDRGEIYDVVSCQFAFHYFVKDIDTVLNLVSKKLRKDGLFIGTASDGDLMKKNLENGNITIPFLNIEQKDSDSYTYDITSRGNDRQLYFEYRGALSEYYLHKDYFIKKCKEYSLEPVNILSFHEWKQNLKYELSVAETIISYFNFSFVFKKVY